ncbi:hypothetical protein [Marinobacter sp. UBA2678]|uniref:hypothetical protein n=1 Tax=Marinobacter sp. UBA2678 TaxID=1946815 RepID=UPI002580F599|nr:hypothetical protein [Marinobacter sp. UBA2678]|tara:strand:+ start:29610 stop:29780 length:171 start_codon:yes stop_codon:yes gene_type:complete
MTPINFLGWVLMLTPFVLVFLVISRRSGVVDALMIYVGVIVLVLTLYIGATLAGFK